MENDFANLEKIISETLQRTITTQSLDLNLFFGQAENEFTRLGYRQSSRGGVKKILLLRLDAVGDFILLTPSIRAVRENYPKAHITLVVTKAVYPFAEFCPYVNEVIVFDTPYTSTTYNRDLIQIIKATFIFSANYLLRRHFDLCFAFLGDPTHLIMSFLSGAKNRVGENNFIGKILMTNPADIDKNKFVHHCERNLALLMSYGLKINSSKLELWINDEDYLRAEKILEGFAPGRLKIAVGIGANVPMRRYPVEKYLVALRKIIDKGASVIIFGGSSEVDDAKFLEDNLPKEFVKNLVKLKSDWRTTAGIISLTDIYIGNDTGTQHVAAALKKPVIVLTRDSKDHQRVAGNNCEHIAFFPWQTDSVILQPEHSFGDCAKRLEYGCIANKPHCIAQIEPSEIVAALDKMFTFKSAIKNYFGVIG